MSGRRFNPPPTWPPVPAGWSPPSTWVPPADWPQLPAGWALWLDEPEVRAEARRADTPKEAIVTSPPPARRGAAETASGVPTSSQVEGVAKNGIDHVSIPVGRGLDALRLVLPRALWTGGDNTASTAGYSSASASPLAASADRDVRDAKILELEATIARLRSSRPDVSEDIVPLDDQQVLQSVGIYRYHHPLEDAASYRERLREIEAEVAELVRAGQAIERSNMFTFDNSLAKGRKMTDDLSKLMLRAYNAEADSAIRALRAGNIETAKRRLEKSRDAIARLGAMMEMRIASSYHELREREIELTSDWLMKKQEEREREREERARLREEKRVQQELDAERERLDKERALIEQTIVRMRANGQSDPELEGRLAAIDAAIEQNDFRAANIRAGYVYVISNRGAFGADVVKIGLTRRLEPLDRVNELGGASVPFRFDVHTIYFSEDAVSLETELHRHFATRALNQANPRKEFFFATPSEVRSVLMQKVGALLEFREDAEASEYLQSVGVWPVRPGITH